jgi:succinate dehydrogenase/fumarate reductase cytochrome b subunit
MEPFGWSTVDVGCLFARRHFHNSWVLSWSLQLQVYFQFSKKLSSIVIAWIGYANVNYVPLSYHSNKGIRCFLTYYRQYETICSIQRRTTMMWPMYLICHRHMGGTIIPGTLYILVEVRATMRQNTNRRSGEWCQSTPNWEECIDKLYFHFVAQVYLNFSQQNGGIP